MHFILRDTLVQSDTLESTVKSQPVYEIPPPKYPAEKIIRILLDPNIDQNKICHHKPSRITSSATYIVNISRFESVEDIKKDEFGIWKYSGSHPKVYRIHHTKQGMKIESASSSAKGADVVYLRRLHCTHPSNPNFKRLICFMSGKRRINITCTCRVSTGFLAWRGNIDSIIACISNLTS